MNKSKKVITILSMIILMVGAMSGLNVHASVYLDPGGGRGDRS